MMGIRNEAIHGSDLKNSKIDTEKLMVECIKALRKRLQLRQSNTGGLGSRGGSSGNHRDFFPSKRPLNHYKMKLSMGNLKYLQGDCWRICRLQLGEVRSSSLQEQTDLPRFPEIRRSPETFEKANLSSAVTDFREKSSWDAGM